MMKKVVVVLIFILFIYFMGVFFLKFGISFGEKQQTTVEENDLLTPDTSYDLIE